MLAEQARCGMQVRGLRDVAGVACGDPATPPRPPTAMHLCIHTASSVSSGYRRALEGWARAGITHVEPHATIVQDFLTTHTPAEARAVLPCLGPGG